MTRYLIDRPSLMMELSGLLSLRNEHLFLHDALPYQLCTFIAKPTPKGWFCNESAEHRPLLVLRSLECSFRWLQLRNDGPRLDEQLGSESGSAPVQVLK